MGFRRNPGQITIAGIFLILVVGYLLFFNSSSWKIVCNDNINIGEILDGPLAQDDPRIINYILDNKIIIPPSSDEYNLKSPDKDPSMGQSTVVKQILNNMEGGFFVECGGLDGETRSNSLNLEKEFGWNGLIIEGDPKNFEILLQKNRKSWASNVCLATKPYPHKVSFQQSFNTGQILEDSVRAKKNRKVVEVQCFPLFTLLSALNIQTVDYFSLDVEGSELPVLETIPFDKILIKVLSVEYMHFATHRNESDVLETFMKKKGYRVLTKVTNSGGLAHDLIFAHKSVKVTHEIKPIKTR